jgi:hypothetical protein
MIDRRSCDDQIGDGSGAGVLERARHGIEGSTGGDHVVDHQQVLAGNECGLRLEGARHVGGALLRPQAGLGAPGPGARDRRRRKRQATRARERSRDQQGLIEASPTQAVGCERHRGDERRGAGNRGLP